jgi:hypothetical protein
MSFGGGVHEATLKDRYPRAIGDAPGVSQGLPAVPAVAGG